jgi:hypothetical protein
MLLGGDWNGVAYMAAPRVPRRRLPGFFALAVTVENCREVDQQFQQFSPNLR